LKPLSNLHSWDLNPREARTVQLELAGRVKLQPLPRRFEVLGASDIAYVAATNQLTAVILTFGWPKLNLLETIHVVAPIRFPYVPGLLSFREIPPLLEAYSQLKRPPDVFLCDGQGLAHPRKFGLASHLGLYLGLPTVGCAKSRLCGNHELLDLHRGNRTPLYYKEEIVGYVFCSRDNVKPIYVSPGHLSDFESSLELISLCLGRYRIPEPLRQAHQIATKLRRKLVAGELL
jgi:deoxyribonuclease V